MKSSFQKRFFEALPGLLSLSLLIIPLLFARFFPVGVATFFLLFALYWLLNSINFSYFLIKSYLQYRKQKKFNWKNIEKALVRGEHSHTIQQQLHTLERTIPQLHYSENSPFSVEDVKHLVFVATYKEPQEVLEDTFRSIVNSDFPLDRVIVVLATEERDQENASLISTYLEQKFGHHFLRMYTTVHPKNIPGEIPGKGGNITYAAKTVVQKMKEEGLLCDTQDYHHYIVTTLDADNQVHKDYFHTLTTYYYLTPSRQHFSYQPLPFLCNNIWNVPIFNRVVALSSTFWHLIESGRPDRLRNFSSHAQPLKALMDMDYWSTQTIVEDGHQFWRSYMHFKGQYQVLPIFVPIYQDAVEQERYFPTLRAQYKQLRRWAFGAEDVAFVIKEFSRIKKLPKLKSFFHLLHLIEGHITWATAPLILALSTTSLSTLSPGFSTTNIYFQLSFILSIFFQIAFVGILISIWVSFLLLPKPSAKSKQKRWYLTLSMFFQWFLLPITTIVFAALPALDAQIRLILGNKLGFNVTKKIRK